MEALSLHNNKVVWNKKLCDHCEKCIQICPHSSSPKITYYSVNEILSEIKKVQHFISGITLSGGECTKQFSFLKALLIACKNENISVFIDTNLQLETEKLKELIPYFDKAMPDVKIFGNRAHQLLTGKKADQVFKNIKFLLQQNKIHEIRTVIYPEFDYNVTVEQVSRLISKHNKHVIYKLIKFRAHGDSTTLNFVSPKQNNLKHLKLLAENKGLQHVIIS
jgi:YjjW family glycine radical enzyme activase